jgi:hypothetical protein
MVAKGSFMEKSDGKISRAKHSIIMVLLKYRRVTTEGVALSGNCQPCSHPTHVPTIHCPSQVIGL